MPKLLMMPDKEVSNSLRYLPFLPLTVAFLPAQGWLSFHRQLVSLLRFLAPFLRKGELGETTRALYLGTQRIILVLLHDFPSVRAVPSRLFAVRS